MYGLFRNAKPALRGGAVLLAALFACSVLTVAAGRIPDSASARMLVPVGHTVGIKLFSKGVMVVKLPDGSTPAKECGLKTGDVILQCGDNGVTSSEQFQALLQTCGGRTTELQVRRSGDHVTLSVEPEQNEQGVYCIGAWIRDSMAGIGTMTYYDPATGAFGALGHGIADVDTAQLMPFGNGTILPSTVKAVKRGVAGDAGELRGAFDLTRSLGALNANTSCGIFGTLEGAYASAQATALPIGQARTGTAVIRSNVAGDEVQEYEIEILKVISNSLDGRNMVLCVKDPALIAMTGGIVQGMSGSPIIQDGRLVGAVTHVFLNDPCKGYGISIENMLEAAG